MNPLQWNWRKARTYGGIVVGAGVGALTGGAASGIATGSTQVALGTNLAAVGGTDSLSS